MSASKAASNIGFFLVGCGIGAVVALLYAPKSGRELRKLITQKAEEGGDYIIDKKRELRDQAEELTEKGRELSREIAERVAGVFEVYKQAYHAALGR